MNSAVAWLVGVIGFLAAVATFSTIVSIPGLSKTIDNGVKALTKLFNGAFGF